MSEGSPIKLIGSVGSPYTRKMVSLLRFRRIPHAIIWGDPAIELVRLGIDPPKFVFHPTFLLPDANGELNAVCDSTPIIRRLEAEHLDRTVLPTDPALAFIDFLLEDFADEWGTKFTFHFRWHRQSDIDNAAKLLPLMADVTLKTEELAAQSEAFAKRQIGRLSYVGSNPVTAPVIEASYRRTLQHLETLLGDTPFLLGSRPASADFALFGQLTQLIGVDPTPRAIAHEVSPRAVAWIGRVEDLSGLSPTPMDWWDGPEPCDGLRGLLTEVGRVYVPALLANARAVALGEKQWEAEIDGAGWTQRTFPYQAKCLGWMVDHYRHLDGVSRARVDRWLNGTGCEALSEFVAEAEAGAIGA